MISKGISKWLLGFKLRIQLCQNKSKYKETKITIIKNKRKIDHQRYKPGMVSLESIKLTTRTSLSSTETCKETKSSFIEFSAEVSSTSNDQMPLHCMCST